MQEASGFKQKGNKRLARAERCLLIYAEREFIAQSEKNQKPSKKEQQ